MSKTNETAEQSLEEEQWTDASIRWPGYKAVTYDSEEEEECGYMDPFKDPDPFNIFSFQFDRPGNSDESIDINIRGYKTDSDEVWESTGLTLWRASEYLCEYQLKRHELFQNKRILEVR